MNFEREKALRDACRVLCIHCAGKVPGYTDAEGPSKRGVFWHRDMVVTTEERKTACKATPIWAMIHRETVTDSQEV